MSLEVICGRAGKVSSVTRGGGPALAEAGQASAGSEASVAACEHAVENVCVAWAQDIGVAAAW